MNLDEKNRNRTQDATPTPDELDDLVAAHFAAGDDLTPSSGFARSVMESLQAEASVPPPIPFPWRRVVPGLLALLCAIAAFGVFALRELRSISVSGTGSQYGLLSPATLPQMHLSALEQALCWIAIATCLSLATVAGCMRLVGASPKMRL